MRYFKLKEGYKYKYEIDSKEELINELNPAIKEIIIENTKNYF